MTPDEKVIADWLLERGKTPRQVRSMLAAGRSMYLRLRDQRRLRNAAARDEAARLAAEDDPWPADDELPWDRGDGDGRCAECGTPIDASETICDLCTP